MQTDSVDYAQELREAALFKFIAEWMDAEGWEVPKVKTAAELLEDLVRQADDRGASNVMCNPP